MTASNDLTQASKTSERSSKLPEEIIETEKSRSDILKWKLVLVAVLGAVGLGLSGKANASPLVLAMIPFVCVYVDLLCCNCNIRTIVIGTYYSISRRDSYERFVGKHRHAFEMENWALYWSTRLLCGLVVIFGLLLLIDSLLAQDVQQASAPPPGPTQEVTNPPVARNPTMASSQGVPSRASMPVSQWFAEHGQGLVLMGAGLIGVLLSRRTKRACKSRLDRLTEPPQICNAKDLMSSLYREYTYEDVMTLWRSLARQGTFTFQPLANGLYPAAASAQTGNASGYQYVWVRDNVHIAHAHYSWGEKKEAARTLSTLLAYFDKHRRRFDDIIAGKADPCDPMNRPHVRFDGKALAEIDQKWPHAQNDALGYFLWCYSKLAQDDDGLVRYGQKELECLARFPRYFQAIRYWQDADSGHWEEMRKVSASSIGTVLAGLREFKRLVDKNRAWSSTVLRRCRVTRSMLKELQDRGIAALRSILTCECTDPACHYRRYDSALLFLIYPLEVLSWSDTCRSDAENVLDDVTTFLEREHGIRRYLGDSYWCADYAKKLGPRVRTGDFSENMQTRDALLRPGEEAQWCIFDPIISVIYGRRYQELKASGDQTAPEFLRLQTEYFNRALRQLTDGKRGLTAFRCPEAYYLKKGHYVPNDHTPLLWTQANLRLAIEQMKQSTLQEDR